MSPQSQGFLAAAAALQFALAPPPAAFGATLSIEICGSDERMNLPLPRGDEGERKAACHGAAVQTCKKKLRLQA